MSPATTFRSDDLTFNAERHEYLLPTGVRVPSVTEILRETGVSRDFEALATRVLGGAQAMAYARARGTAVHSDAHAYDDGELDWATVDPAVKPYLDAWVTFRQNVPVTPVLRERRIYHPVYGYAGTLDGVFRHQISLRHVLVDLKTGDPEDAACRYQTAAYVEALRVASPDRRMLVLDRMAVQLCPDATIPYRITLYSHATQASDFRKFAAFITTYHEQFTRRTVAAA